MNDLPWGFVVERSGDGFVVYLGRWAIAGEHGGYTAVSQDNARADLQSFISEALQALKALKAGREFGNGAPL